MDRKDVEKAEMIDAWFSLLNQPAASLRFYMS